MARAPEPWRRSGQGGAWYAQVAGRKVWLAPSTATKADARTALARVLTGGDARVEPAGSAPVTVAEVVAAHLEDARARARQGSIRPITLEGYLAIASQLTAGLGDRPAGSLTPEQVLASAVGVDRDDEPRPRPVLALGALLDFVLHASPSFRSARIVSTPAIVWAIVTAAKRPRQNHSNGFMVPS